MMMPSDRFTMVAKVVVGQDDVGRILGDVGARNAMDTPMSARLMAGASFTPSPVMAVFRHLLR